MENRSPSTEPARRFVVELAEAGQRLDAFLARALGCSVHGARRALEEGQVVLETTAATGSDRTGAPARTRRGKKGERLCAGDVVRIGAPGPPPTPGPPPLRVLHVDDDLVVVDKPAGLPSVGLRPDEGGTLAAALVARFPECATAGPRPEEGGLAHRLDTGTSGVLVAARSPAAWTALREALGGADGEKLYLAEVFGHLGASSGDGAPWIERSAKGWVVSAPIGRTGRRGVRVQLGVGRGLLPAWTAIELVESRGPTALVAARLTTGRPHQVRVHLAHLGVPVLGDPLYGTPEALAHATAVGIAGFRLHAFRIVLTHPRTHEPVRFEAPPPAWAHGVASKEG